MKSDRVLAALALVASAVVGASPAAAAGPDGSVLFRQRCQTCHTVNPAQKSPLGPNLAGVAGRRAASTAFNYSPALKASNLTWNRATLDRFLTAPMRAVPGTRMVISVPDAAQRAAILDFLGARR